MMKDKELVDHLTGLLDAEPKFRRLIAGMLIQDNGDLRAFVQGYRIERRKMKEEIREDLSNLYINFDLRNRAFLKQLKKGIPYD